MRYPHELMNRSHERAGVCAESWIIILARIGLQIQRQTRRAPAVG